MAIKVLPEEVAREPDRLRRFEREARAGEEDKLFGSVTNGQIAEKLVAMGYQVDRRAIVLDEPIT